MLGLEARREEPQIGRTKVSVGMTAITIAALWLTADR